MKDEDREKVMHDEDLKKLKLIKHQKYEEIMRSQLEEKEQIELNKVKIEWMDKSNEINKQYKKNEEENQEEG